jgi:DNA-binding PadR family transcriptional regulator
MAMPLDLTNPFELTVSQAVLTLETNGGRFETFCRDVVSLIEGGAIIFSTSRSWDLGRDGVGAGAARGIYVCTSLRDDVDDKALSDLNRIKSTTNRIERLYFCSSQKLSEHRITLLEGQLADEIDHAFPITCLGATQLTEAAAIDPAVVSRHYAAEIQSALRAISAEPSDETEIRGLRLALMAAAGENSTEIRLQLYSGGLLDALSDGKTKTIAGCAKALSERLRIGYVVSEAAIRPHLMRLVADDLVAQSGLSFTLTASGREHLDRVQAEAAERFLGGRLEVRKALEESIGSKLAEDDFRRIWSIFEERIAHHFHARGEALVAEVSALLENSPSGSATQKQTQRVPPARLLDFI